MGLGDYITKAFNEYKNNYKQILPLFLYFIFIPSLLVSLGLSVLRTNLSIQTANLTNSLFDLNNSNYLIYFLIAVLFSFINFLISIYAYSGLTAISIKKINIPLVSLKKQERKIILGTLDLSCKFYFYIWFVIAACCARDNFWRLLDIGNLYLFRGR